MNINEYFSEIEREVKNAYSLAGEAKKKGFDPVAVVEIPLANSLAERVTGLVSVLYPQIIDQKIVKRILELEKEHGPLDPGVALTIAEEIAKEKYCKFQSHLEAIEAGIRVAIGYLTLGYVSSPIEGFVQLKLKKTKEGKDYFAPYYSGPIRSAGGSEAAFSLVIIDYLREVFGYARYDPTEDEVKRGIQECYEYHERVTNLQYLPSERELEFLMKNLPIQLSGDPSEDKEVYNYKDLPRVETNFIRNGFCLVLGEGIAQKAPKVFKRVQALKKKGFKLSDWDWLGEFLKLQKKIKEEKTSEGTRGGATYIQDLVAGRPVFAHPSESGAFRLRYGRSRNTGYSTLAIHPATMAVTRGFISIGTQLKIEKPTKGCTIASCDSVDGPIVKLNDGSVKYLEDVEEAKKSYDKIEEILYLGDILVPYGDFINRNHNLEKAGYVEQYWLEELRKAGGESESNINFDKALDISRRYGVALHPNYIYYWRGISKEEFLGLVDWIAHGEIREGKLILPYNHSERERFAKGKRGLELIGCEQKVHLDNVILDEVDSRALLFNFGIEVAGDGRIDNLLDRIIRIFSENKEKEILEIVNSLCSIKIKDKSGTFIGARMGRPEKAKLRKLDGSPNVLFPVGQEGGRLRSFQAALAAGGVKAEFPNYYCQSCKKETIYSKCEACNANCMKRSYCPECMSSSYEKCMEHNLGVNYKEQRIDINQYYESARKKSGLKTSDGIVVVKGVRGTSNKDHSCEYLGKGLLRAKYNLQVNKDGTIRYDMTEMPITQFKPFEIGTSISKLKELGYEKDIYGNFLEKEDQILEIFPHDIILPACPESPDEKADSVFLNVAKFIDDELENIYGAPKYFNAKEKADLVGVLLGCISPHISATVVGRIIGFSKVQAMLASPYIHAAMRRDCVHPKTKLFFYDADTKSIFYDGIGGYVEKLISEGAKTKVIDSYGTISVENRRNIYTLGIDSETHELKKKKIKYFIKGAETKEWVKIKTATNREYVMTPTHKFMHIIDDKFVFKDAKDAKVDDKLPVLEQLNFVISQEKLDVIELFRESLDEKEKEGIIVLDKGIERGFNEFLGKGEEEIYIRWKFSKHLIPSVIKVDKELMRFLGYYAAEGYSRVNKWVAQVGFRICNKDMQKNLNEIIWRIFGIKSNVAENGSKITVCSKVVYYLVKSLKAGRGAYEKRVPSFIFGLEKDLAAEYISAYYEGDGSVAKLRNICFYSVSRDLLDDVALLLTKFWVIGRYASTKERIPGKRVLDRYRELGKEPKKHILHHLVLGNYDSYKILPYLRLISRKKEAFNSIRIKDERERYVRYNGKQVLMNAQSDYVEDMVKSVEIARETYNSYCVEIEWKEKEDRNVLWGEQIINTRCDGDEAAVMLLMDLLLNFSRKFLPSHRGGTQDAPLVLNMRIRANEVDDMVFDVDVSKKIPLELYEAAERHAHPSEVKMEQVKERLGKQKEFEDIGYSYDTSNINLGSLCSSYKTLPTMQEKVDKMMELCRKIRAVDVQDVSRLVIERHFIRDTRGNLRKFSQQRFRCVNCNEKYRRPPLVGKCTKCGGRLLFTVSEGGILKYMQPALDLAKKYKVSPYLLESLELTEMYIQSIFGKEKEKQESIGKWF